MAAWEDRVTPRHTGPLTAADLTARPLGDTGRVGASREDFSMTAGPVTAGPVTACSRLRRVPGGLLATLVAGVVAGAAVAAGPPASGAKDPCSASEVARTAGSVVKSMGDYLDAHPEANQTMTTLLQEQSGPQSFGSLKTYFEANPKVAADMQKISEPLTGLSLQCKLPVSLPQVMGLMQQMQGGGGLSGLPGAPGALPVGGTTGADPLSGAPRGNTVG